MKRNIFILAFLAVLLPLASVAQNGNVLVTLDASYSTSFPLSMAIMDEQFANMIYDDGGPDGNYTGNQDRAVCWQGNCHEGRLTVYISYLDVHRSDTIYIYDGQGFNGRLLAKINNSNGDWVGKSIYIDPAQPDGVQYITVRFKADANFNGGGFALSIECGSPCEVVTPYIDDVFYRTRNGVIYDTSSVRQIAVYDTVRSTLLYHVDENGDTIYEIDHIDTGYFTGANLCAGDGVIFRGHCTYTYETGYYYPTDSTTTFVWNMANENDSMVGVGLNEVYYEKYQNTECYDLSLAAIDEYGCSSAVYSSVRVRVSLNPIKTIFTLRDICNNDSLMVNIGYSGENATLTLREVEQNKPVMKVNEIRTFLPDGSCPNLLVAGEVDPRCFRAPVFFTEFPGSRRVQDKEDICSICINMEHSFMGDVTVSIVCPIGLEAHFFIGTMDNAVRNALVPSGSNYAGADGGGGRYMGYPLEGDNDDSNSKCDSLRNPFGLGLDYCFTRNSAYTLVTGDPANISGHPAGNFYIVSNGYMDSYTNPPWEQRPSYFTNATPPTPNSGTTKHPSNHANMSDYYLPFTDFSELVGCPLNGEWSIRVCDKWGIDNGWLFNWSMDICGVSTDDDCKYTVGIDSLIWRPKADSIYHDYELGHYRGLEVHKTSPTVSYILSPDTAGVFPIDVLVYDDFGCIWDTVTRITTYWTPEPSLGPDTSICGVESLVLDATDRHTPFENYTYLWDPFAQKTDTIHTATWQMGKTDYIVQVTNTQRQTKCTARDTISVALLRQPIPGYMPSVIPLEGCSPLTITFENLTIDGDEFLWDFGDGITSQLKNPTHSYAAGVYDFKYYARSSDGCIDSLVYPEHIAVYDAPHAAFEWSPTYPSMLNPTIHLVNHTEPRLESNDYFWEIQYNRDNAMSVETLLDEDAYFDFSQYGDELSGNYTLRLISRTSNLAPSGNIVYCRDTSENTVMVVNDYLQFPNVVTPNGDGINDRFVIRNLVGGLAYPNNSLYIYNKWGTLVYHKENISRDEDFWDPSDMPDGTYFYRFTAQGYNGNIEHNGAIEVMR